MKLIFQINYILVDIDGELSSKKQTGYMKYEKYDQGGDVIHAYCTSIDSWHFIYRDSMQIHFKELV